MSHISAVERRVGEKRSLLYSKLFAAVAEKEIKNFIKFAPLQKNEVFPKDCKYSQLLQINLSTQPKIQKT